MIYVRIASRCLECKVRTQRQGRQETVQSVDHNGDWRSTMDTTEMRDKYNDYFSNFNVKIESTNHCYYQRFCMDFVKDK